MKTFDYTVKDELGIHARPAGLLVKEAKNFTSKITIKKGEKEVDATRGDGTYVISTIYMENDVLGFGNVEDRYRLALDLFDVRLMIEPEIVTWVCRKATDMMRWIGLMNNIRACADEIVLNDIVYS